MTKKEYFSCRDLTELHALEGCALLAGGAGLEARVRRISVSDNRDLLRWTEPGDVLLTSGFLFRNDFSGLEEQIPLLKEAGVAALCLKMQQSEMPQSILQLSDALSFPIIRLPADCIFSNVSIAVSEAIFNMETLSHRTVQNRIESFLDAVSDNLGLKHILETLEDLLGNAVILLDDSNEMITTVKTADRFRGFAFDLAHHFRRCAAQSDPTLELDGHSCPLSIFPINTGALQPSLIIICGINGPISELDNTSISRISRMLAVEIRNSSTIHKIQRKYKNQFAQDWLLGNLKTETDILLAAANSDYNFQRQSRYQVAILRLPEEAQDEAQIDHHISAVRRAVKETEANILFTFFDEHLIFLLDDPLSPGRVPPYFSALLHRLEKLLRAESLSICVSSVQPPLAVPEAYEETKKLLFISQQCGIQDPFIFRENLGIYSLLALLPAESADVHHFRERYLAPLREYDAQHHSDLVRTLRVYLASNHNTRATANRMFAHYNTISYRINRIKEILQLDIDDVDISVELNIAFKLEAMR